MSRRQVEGRETRSRLLNWDRDSAAAERLAGHVLRGDGFEAIDPIHPLGGPDGLKDVVCTRQGQRWIAAAYFPSKVKSFRQIKSKFLRDSSGTIKNQAKGFAFITNQRLTDAERRKMENSVQGVVVEIYHMERLASILDSPAFYGVRLEFLDIEMSKDEQVAFIAQRDLLLGELAQQLRRLAPLLDAIESDDPEKLARLKTGVPLQELREFHALLNSLTGFGATALTFGPHISGLTVPLQQLKEFRAILWELSGFSDTLGPRLNRLYVPLEQLREFRAILQQITGFGSALALEPHVQALNVPLERLKEFRAILLELSGGTAASGFFGQLMHAFERLAEYERTLDRVIQKTDLIGRNVLPQPGA